MPTIKKTFTVCSACVTFFDITKGEIQKENIELHENVRDKKDFIRKLKSKWHSDSLKILDVSEIQKRKAVFAIEQSVFFEHAHEIAIIG